MQYLSARFLRNLPFAGDVMALATDDAHLDSTFVVVFDCESDCSMSKCPGATYEEKLGRYMNFTVCCALVLPTSAVLAAELSPDAVMQMATRYHWWRDELDGSTPLDGMLSLFDRADAIVGYNCLSFDFPLIRRFYRSVSELENAAQRYVNHRAKCVDLMARVRDVTGCCFKLNALLETNGLGRKTSDGLGAIRMWEEQQRDELQRYCAEDVDLTARLALVDDMTVAISSHAFLKCPNTGLRSALSKMV